MSIPIADLVFKGPTVRAGVTLTKDSDIGTTAMSLADFDFRVPSAQPGESHPLVLDESFYAERFPGLPDNAGFALAKAGQGMKAKQIRSEFKKYKKRMVVSSGHKIVSFD